MPFDRRWLISFMAIVLMTQTWNDYENSSGRITKTKVADFSLCVNTNPLQYIWTDPVYRKLYHIREVSDSRTWDIFIQDTAYFIVILLSIRSYFIESQWIMLYPVWKCLTYGLPQRSSTSLILREPRTHTNIHDPSISVQQKQKPGDQNLRTIRLSVPKSS